MTLCVDSSNISCPLLELLFKHLSCFCVNLFYCYLWLALMVHLFLLFVLCGQMHSEHHEVVADLHQTSFLFSIPIDGPMSFSTSKVTVQWSLRFEFFTTPEGTDPTRYATMLTILCAGTLSCLSYLRYLFARRFDQVLFFPDCS